MKILHMRFLCLILTGLFLFSCGEEEKETPVRDKQDTVAAEKKEYPIGLDSQPASEEDRLAVTWTGSRMYVSQVDTMLYNQMKVARRLDHIKAMEPEQLAEERMRIVNDLVGNYLLILEAYDSQLALSAAEKDQLMNHLKGQYENEADYKKALEKAGQTEESVLHAVSSKYLADLCLRKKKQEFYQDITPEAKQAFYERKIAMFTPPHRSHFNQVYIKAKKGRSLEQAQELAETLRAEVKQKMEAVDGLEEKRKAIQECAREFSDGSAGKVNYGYRIVYHDGKPKPEFAPTYLQEIKEAKIGKLSNVHKNEDGYAFFFLIDKVPSKIQKFSSDGVQKTIPHLIVEEKIEDWKHQLREKYQVKIYGTHLKQQPFSGPDTTSAGEVDTSVSTQ